MLVTFVSSLRLATTLSADPEKVTFTLSPPKLISWVLSLKETVFNLFFCIFTVCVFEKVTIDPLISFSPVNVKSQEPISASLN